MACQMDLFGGDGAELAQVDVSVKEAMVLSIVPEDQTLPVQGHGDVEQLQRP